MPGANASTFASVEDRFYAKVVAGPNECHIWIASRTPQEYGIFWFGGRMDRAHRVAWMLHHGAIPHDMVVRHVVCDNPACVNPKHLAVGTDADNVNDRVSKGRSVNPKGEAHGCAKLTAEQVFEIQMMDMTDRTQRSVAKQFNVSQKTIWRILNGKGWAT